MPVESTDKSRRIVDVVLDEDSVARRTPEVEHERAVALFERACDADHREACGNLAFMVDDGRGTRRNRTRALGLFDEACSLGEAESCFTLGRAYQLGKGVPLDKDRAIELLERSLSLDPDTESAGEARKALEIARGLRKGR